MKWILFIILLCNIPAAFAEDFDVYCRKSLKGKYSSKRKKSICWCVEDNLRSQLPADERAWLLQRVIPPKKTGREKASTVELVESSQTRVKKVEFEVFKNCTSNHNWKAHKDDIGEPDDITAP